MKKTLLSMILLIAAIQCFSQNYLINFTVSSPDATITYDSIQVTNLNSPINNKITLFYGDTLMLGNLGLSDFHESNNDLLIYPNPASGSVILSVNLSDQDLINISIYDISGREVIKKSEKLIKGFHKFMIYGLKQGVYLANVKAQNFNKSVRLVNNFCISSELNISYIGYESPLLNNKTKKNTNLNSFLNYFSGDVLFFKAYKGNYIRIITNIPTSSNTIHINFIECKDFENHNYATVKIGSQNWMAENLKATTYRNGDSIPFILADTNWMNTTNGAYGFYNNNANMTAVYGNLYNFYAVNDIRKLCPSGWKTPSENDWNSLITYLGGDLVAGGKMKETGYLTWINNTAASNSSGFSALGSGMRSMYGHYSESGIFAYYWSADMQSPYTSFYKRLYNLNNNITTDFSSFNDGFSARCIKDTSNMISYMAALTTIPVTNITISTAHSGGNVTDFGGSAIVNRGLCYSTSPNPTIDDSVVYLQGPIGNGAFTGDISGLTGGTTYYVKAFVVNAFSVAYGNEMSFTTQLPANGGLTDIDGNVYDTIVIGTQVWMRQNLKVTKYNNGNNLPHITANAAWSTLTSGAYCNYGNNTSTGAVYGKLYNWYVVNDNRNICPVNWHVPNVAEWQTLENYLGGSSIAGGKLKEVDTVYWAAPNANATNSSGFTAYAGGSRSTAGVSGDLGYYGYWWSTVEQNTLNAYAMDLSYGNGTSHLYQRNKTIGMSIRCIKDTILPPTIIDIDGNIYDTVHIGIQVWMKQNLKTTKYRNGNPIPQVINNSSWSGLVSGAYCNYNNDTSNANVYGRLYNWFAVVDSRNLCPAGWHIPSHIEWNALASYLGGYAIAGGKLKEAGLSHWNTPNTGATNETGFTALPGGYRLSNSSDMGLNEFGHWWSSTEDGADFAYFRIMNYSSSDLMSMSGFLNHKTDGFSVRCIQDTLSLTAVLPTLTTTTATSITATSVISGGIITSNGGSAIIAKGVCYNTSPNPTTFNGTANSGSGTNSFTNNIYGLFPNTTYFLRAYATNSIGTAYGNQISFTTLQGSGSVLVYDIDGNAYDTIHIGNQAFLKQNLKTTKYNNGDPISNVTNAGNWGSLNTAAYCNYNNDSLNANIYGRLYNWYAVADPRNICPAGWHVPDTTEAIALISYLGGNSIAGGKLKEAGLAHWQSPNTGASNSSNFTALPGGYRYYDGSFYVMGSNAWFWSKTEYSGLAGFALYLSYDAANSYDQFGFKPNGFSVRCIKNQSVVPPPLQIMDIDGNAYDTVHIGTQVWMKQNLKTTKYRNGSTIQNVTDSISWAALTNGAYGNYNNDTLNVNTYGRLYNYAAVADSRNLCPLGWHIPNNYEWATLNSYLGGESVAGGKLKEAGLSHWNAPNTSATNSSGFTALPAGNRHYFFGNYGYIGEFAQWWSYDEFNASYAYYESLYRLDSNASFTYTYKNQGFSVRCIKDTILPFKVYDIDGNAYDTVKIGTQFWLKQNLKTTKYRNGDSLQNVTNANAWAALTVGAYSNYNNDTNMAVTYGRLYNWFSVADTRNICPLGWHVPSDGEWTVLENYLGGSSVAGGNLKETGYSHWQAPNTNATNSSNFTALPGGNRLFNGVFATMGSDGNWWTSTEYNSLNGLNRSMYSNGSNVSSYNHNKPSGYSVRCMKDTVVVIPFKVYDIDGIAYDTVQIGAQVWLKQNLKTTKLNDGSSIPNVTDTTWRSLNTPAYCMYNNSIINANIYGYLYNWQTVNTGLLCPVGWHVPSDTAWNELINYLGGWNIAGNKLREPGNSHWNVTTANVTNSSGFTALPGGYRNHIDYTNFNTKGNCGNWWSSSLYDTTDAKSMFIDDYSALLQTQNIKRGFSVRCIKN